MSMCSVLSRDNVAKMFVNNEAEKRKKNEHKQQQRTTTRITFDFRFFWKNRLRGRGEGEAFSSCFRVIEYNRKALFF